MRSHAKFGPHQFSRLTDKRIIYRVDHKSWRIEFGPQCFREWLRSWKFKHTFLPCLLNDIYKKWICHIKIDYPVSSKLFAQKPGLKNICLKYSLPSLLRSEDGLSGYLRSGERQKDFGKDFDAGFRQAQLWWAKYKRAGINKRLRSPVWKIVLGRIKKHN